MAVIEKIDETRYSLSNPATLEHLYDIECQSKEQVDAVIAKARQAQSAWAALSIKERVQYFLKLRDVILAKQDYIIDTVVKETGKSKQDALTLEVYAVAAFISYWCHRAPKTLKDEVKRAPGIMSLVKKVHFTYKPLGVVGVIAPWNGPLVLAANPSIQAMMAGNTVVAKGSEITPKSTKLLEELCAEAGFPEGVCNVLIGDGQTGAYLTQGDVDKVSFTGSTATGKKVAAACIERLIPYSLELGGKDAMIVCNDADLDKAAHGAVWGGCVNTGHYCCGVERIYVEEGIYDSFVSKVAELAKSVRQGQNLGFDEDLGAVFWDKQLDIIEAHVEDAKQRGANILTGGKRLEGKGLYYPPTVITDIEEQADILSQETFGPTLPIIKVKNAEEAIAKANQSNFGLHGSVWTKDVKKGLSIAKQINTGSMAVNDIGMMYGIANAPFAGVKDSGAGSMNGEYGLRNYTHTMPIVVGMYRGEDSGYPHNRSKFEQMQKLMKFLWQNPIGKFLFRS